MLGLKVNEWSRLIVLLLVESKLVALSFELLLASEHVFSTNKRCSGTHSSTSLSKKGFGLSSRLLFGFFLVGEASVQFVCNSAYLLLSFHCRELAPLSLLSAR